MDASQVQEPDVVDLLVRQHDEIRRLFAHVREVTDDRQDSLACLVRLLAVHETAEEMIVHPMLRGTDSGGDIVEARLVEEAEAKQALADLEQMDVEDPGFDAALERMRAMAEAHAAHEERDESPLLRTQIDPELRRLMADRVVTAERFAPTHPHPHGPDSALGNLIVGPFVAVADRVRDALRAS